MKRKKVGFEFKGKKYSLEVGVCSGVFSKMKGLMFCSREKASALVFEFSKLTKMKIHSCFVFFDFLAIWLDEENKVLEMKVVSPWNFSLSSEKPFKTLIEVPCNKKYSKFIGSLVGDF